MIASKSYWLVAVCALSSAACSGGDEEEEDKSGVDESGTLALTVMIANPNTMPPDGRVCPTSTGIQWDIGARGDGVSAKCFVQSSGKFHVSAQGTDEMITRPNGTISLDLEGQATAGGAMTGSFNTPVTQTIASGNPACIVTVVNALGRGALDIGFECPLLTASDQPTLGCRASGGLLLDGCGD